MSRKIIALSHAENRALEHAAHNDKFGWNTGSNRTHRLVTWRKLEKRGMVVEEWCYLCDGDGFNVQPERYMRAFKLTKPGHKQVAMMAALRGKEYA